MGLWGKFRRWFRSPLGQVARVVIEGQTVEEIVRRHWPAVRKTLIEEGYDEKCFEAARRACERLIEHML